MKAIKFLSIFLMLGFLALTVSVAEGNDFSKLNRANNFKNWKVISSQTGGYAGINKSFTLDETGTLTHRDRNKETTANISAADVQAIAKMLKELNLPNAKLKTIKGQKIYDGIYSEFTISLDEKEYKLGGNFFYDTKVVALNAKQQKIFEKLKRKFESIGATFQMSR